MQQFQGKMITAIGQLRTDHARSRRSSSHHSRGEVGQGNQDRTTSNVVRTADTRSDRPLRPQFLPSQNNKEPPPKAEEEETRVTVDVMVARDEYMQLPADVRQLMNLNQFVNQRRDKARNRQERQDRRLRGPVRQAFHPLEYKDALNKINIPTFNGTGELSARSWVHKLDTFLALKPMEEEKAVQFATMHLEGVA